MAWLSDFLGTIQGVVAALALFVGAVTGLLVALDELRSRGEEATATTAPAPTNSAPAPATSAPPALLPVPSGPGKARVTGVRPADGQPGIGREVLVEVTVDQSPARDRTLFLIAYLPQQGATIPHAIYVAKAKVPTDRGRYSIQVKLGDGPNAVGLVRIFQVVSADKQATEILSVNLARQFDTTYDGRRLGLPDGALELDSSPEIKRTRP